jgi:glucose/mannose-6-phosphate isomerase
MNNLDDIQAMKVLDTKNVIESTALFADQCEQAWEEGSNIQFPSTYFPINNIIVSGMGGSRFTPLTIKELFRDRIKKPYEIIDEYTIPSYVDEDTLVILSSYSGSTDEVVSCSNMAFAQKAKITAVTSGGIISQIAQKYNFPIYIFSPKYNPCGQPRIGGGYLLMGHIGILKSLKLLDIKDSEIYEAIEYARLITKSLLPEIPIKDNTAKQMALRLCGKHPFIITSQFLKGFGNGFANQINETAKTISDCRFIPELNHHLMEGLKYPETEKQNWIFVLIRSSLYCDSIQKRFSITQDILKKQHIEFFSYETTGDSKISQVLGLFVFSGFVSVYLAILNGENPVEIPLVNYFKKKMLEK